MNTRWTAAIALGLLVAPVAARADDAARAEAKRRVVEGAALARQGKFEEARLRYSEACVIVHTYNCIVGLASAELRSEHFVEAFDHLREAQRDPHEAAASAEIRHQVALMFPVAQQATAHIVVSARAGTGVTVDGKMVGVAPLSESVTTLPGKHSLEWQTPAGVQRLEVAANAGEPTPVDLLSAESPAAPPAAVAPVLPSPKVSAPAAPSPRQNVSVADDTSGTWWTPLRKVGVGAGVLAVAGLGAGIAFRVAVSGNDNDVGLLRSSLPTGGCSTGATTSSCSSLQEKTASANQNATFGNIGFAVGGVAAATSVGLLVFGGSRPDKAQTGGADWHAVVGPGSFGIAGHF